MSTQPPNLNAQGSPPPPPGMPGPGNLPNAAIGNLSPANQSPTEAISPVPGEKPCQYPPYPPYSSEPQPVSLMDMIMGGQTIRYQFKTIPPKPARSPPKPAQPKGPKVTDVRLTRREYRSHARCLRRNSALLTERLERISKPSRRQIIYMWRDKANVLPAETIARFRSMLDADEPFKPDQAYQYFTNMKKSKKKNKSQPQGLKAKPKKKIDLYGDKKCEWARNATVTFARSIQQQLGRPGAYTLQDGMLNMSNVVMCEIAKYLHMKPVHRQCDHPKGKFLMELSDKIAVWIDEVMLESDERMLMMDADEDDEVLAMYAGGGGYGGFGGPGGDQFADEFLDMMGGKRRGKYEMASQPAHKKFKGEMKNAFDILTKAMDAKGNETLLEYGKHKETYRSGADELRRATDFTATELNMNLAKEVKQKLKAITDDKTPEKTKPHMKAMIDISGDYLAQHAEYSKDKGPAFKMLVQKMKAKGSAPLYKRNNFVKPYKVAAKDLEDAKGLDADGDDPDLTTKIQSELENTVQQYTPSDLKDEMKDTIEKSSKYLSHKAVESEERGEAFDMLIKLLERTGDNKFSPDHKELETNHLAAHALKTAPRLNVANPDPALAAEFQKALVEVALKDTPPEMLEEMKEVIRMCSNYLSVYVRERRQAMQSLLQHMKSKGNQELVRRLNYGMTYAKGAQEVEEAPGIVPYLPVKDIADEVHAKLTEGMKDKTPEGLEDATKGVIKDVAGHLSQPVALRSGVAGERYPINYLANVMESLGERKLYEYKDFKQTYASAASELKAAGVLDTTSQEDLAKDIDKEMKVGVRTRVGPGLHSDLGATMTAASKHLANSGHDRAEALNHLVKEMTKKGDQKLARLQGYDQTYKEAATRLQKAKSLETTRVDQNAYKEVGSKLNMLMKEKPPPEKQASVMPDVVDESSKFLAAPLPETKGEKRKILADLMSRKQSDVLGKDGLYKMTYDEGGKEFVEAPYDISPVSVDPVKQKELTQVVKSVIPPESKPLLKALSETTAEAGSHLTDVIKGRKEAMDVIHSGLKQGADKDLINTGQHRTTYADGAKMVEEAPHFKKGVPEPAIYDQVEKNIDALPKSGVSELAAKHMDSTTEIASKFIASAAKAKSDMPKQDKTAAKTSALAVTTADASKGTGSSLTAGLSSDLAGGQGSALAGGTGSSLAGGPGSGLVGKPDSALAVGPASASKKTLGSASAGKPDSALAVGPASASKKLLGSTSAGKPDSALAVGPGSASAKALGSASAGKPDSALAVGPGSASAKALGSASAGKPDSALAVGPGSASAKALGSTSVGGLASASAGGLGSVLSGKPDSALAGGPGSAVAGGALSPGVAPGGPGTPSAGGPGSGPEKKVEGGPGSVAGVGPGSTGGSPGKIPVGPVGSSGVPDGVAGKSGSGPTGGPGSGIDGTGKSDSDSGWKKWWCLGKGEKDGEKAEKEGFSPLGEKDGGGGEKGGRGGEGAGAGGGGRSKSGGRSGHDDDAPGRRGGRDARSPGARGKDAMRGRDEVRGGKRGADRLAGRGARTARSVGSAEGAVSSFSSEEEVDPNSCPCALAAARVKRRHMRRQQRQETLRQFKTNALEILRKEVAAKGNAPFYSSANLSTFTHKQASDWLGASMRVEPSVKTSSDVTRLQAKFEDKLFDLMQKKYPDSMEDAVQDVVIESARKLAENYVSKHYQKAARNAYISEMQKKGNTLLTDDGETYFYAAQRLKRTEDLHEPEPCEQTSPYLQQELDNTIRGRSIPRKMVGTMKGYSKTIADYLSTRVGKPDKEITAYCNLLDEMEAQGDKDLVNNKMKLSYKEGTDYLRQLVSNDDTINKPDRGVSDQINQNLAMLVNTSTTMIECDPTEVKKVKTRSTNLLTSYVSSQVDKTEALKGIVEAMEHQGDAVLLRHGPVVRTFKDGADRLRNKNASQIHSYISKSGPPDPVVLRKINVRIGNIANEALTKRPEVTQDVTTYLAKSFTEPHVSRLCQCRKSVPVQCDLWCDDRRRAASPPPPPPPCCLCPRCAASSAAAWRPAAGGLVACEEAAGRRCAADQPAEQCPAYALHAIQYEHAAADRLSRALLQPPTRDDAASSKLTNADYFYAMVNTSDTSNVLSDSTSANWASQVEASEREPAPERSLQPTFGSMMSAPSSFFEQKVSTDEMCDWNAMLVSLMWNMQAWRHWIHEQMNLAQIHNHEDSDNLPSWTEYEKTVAMEALQWRQYNTFSKQLATKLSYRYRNKQIVSPTRETNKTKEYLACQSEMIDMIGMFKKWTHWLSLVVNETRDMDVPAATAKHTLNKLRWNHFFYKLQERAEDWRKYDMYFGECWKENTLKKIPGWVPGWRSRAVWVVSACGAVPSGAVLCGARRGQRAWLARTTHRCQVLPAALLPSKHCCIVYADEKVFQYSKYQVLCNADVDWMPWHSGSVSSSAVLIGPKSYAGRVIYKGSHLLGPVLPPHYRCHVVLMGRPFAFNSYQLLVFTDTNK